MLMSGQAARSGVLVILGARRVCALAVVVARVLARLVSRSGSELGAGGSLVGARASGSFCAESHIISACH